MPKLLFGKPEQERDFSGGITLQTTSRRERIDVENHNDNKDAMENRAPAKYENNIKILKTIFEVNRNDGEGKKFVIKPLEERVRKYYETRERIFNEGKINGQREVSKKSKKLVIILQSAKEFDIK